MVKIKSEWLVFKSDECLKFFFEKDGWEMLPGPWWCEWFWRLSAFVVASSVLVFCIYLNSNLFNTLTTMHKRTLSC